MRIVGGAHRGRALAGVGAGDAKAHLRPTTDRVRESMFNLLAHGGYGDPAPPEGRSVLDLFAGTGALGFEALSRGALRASFVDRGRKALGLLKENAARLGLEAQSRILACDALSLGAAKGPACDMVFLDPPYGTGMGRTALSGAIRGGWIADGALVVWEEREAPAPMPGLTLLDSRRYGDTCVSILRFSAR